MCGICGFVGFPTPAESFQALSTMVRTLRQRGPDGEGQWLSDDRRIGLGHTRLAVIDLDGGAQPMTSTDGRFVAVFNGEIYNFRELRRELEQKGHAFRTQSDTEVLIEAFHAWGEEAFRKCRGMFAFGIYDIANKTLLLARDPTGIKPLYYARARDGFYFASEIKALMSVAEVPRRLNFEALVDFLMLGYPLIPKTMFADVFELMPGTWTRISQTSSASGRFWSWSPKPRPRSWKEALEATESALVESLRDHLVSDVPLGAFLSGGIDSSLLVSLLVRKLGLKVETFSVRFTESTYDESPYARMVARTLSTKHHELVIENAAADISVLDRVADYFDQPFGDSSAVPTYLLCNAIRQHVKVAISGDGGDEMFGGYRRFWYADVASGIGRLPQPVLRVLDRSRGLLTRISPQRARQYRRLLTAARSQASERLLSLSCYLYSDDIRSILRPEALAQIGDYSPVLVRSASRMDCGGRAFIDATIDYALPGDYLRKVDMMSGANGLEVRIPFLGAQVLDLSATLPTQLKYSHSQNKPLLRSLAARHCPAVIAKKKKWGFGIPLDTWLGSNGRLRIAQVFTNGNGAVCKILNPAPLLAIKEGFVSQRWDSSMMSRSTVYQLAFQLWSLERWLAKWRPSPV